MLTFSTPTGKLTHAIKGTAVKVEDQPDSVLATTLCGRQWVGRVAEGNVRTISCSRCAEVMMGDHPEPRVLTTPEAIRETYQRVAETGRQRHGRIIQERAARRRAMKEQVRELARTIPQR